MKNGWMKWAGALALLLGVLALGASGARAASPAAGRSVFMANCTPCHGPSATGVPSMAAAFGVDVELMNLTKALHEKTNDQVEHIVTHGLNGKMPSFQGQLSKTQIADVVSYLRTLDPKWVAKSPAKKAAKPVKTASAKTVSVKTDE